MITELVVLTSSSGKGAFETYTCGTYRILLDHEKNSRVQITGSDLTYSAFYAEIVSQSFPHCCQSFEVLVNLMRIITIVIITINASLYLRSIHGWHHSKGIVSVLADSLI